MSRKPRILIVEDEEAILTGLTDVFLYHGYEVDSSRNGKEGLAKASAGTYDLLLLDVMLPEVDGFSICDEIRNRDRDQLIIMLTAKTSDEDIVQGLKLGADDYITKPFSIQELVLRVQAVLRRSSRLQREEAILELASGLRIDTKTLNGTTTSGSASVIMFTRREVEILLYLKNKPDLAISRGELLEEVWGYRKAATLDTRTVDIHIAKLRRKIESDPKNPQILVTVRGEGYQLMLAAKAKA